MKTVKTIIAGLLLIGLVPISAMAQKKAEVIAVINRADWCPICQANGKRANMVFKKNNMNGDILFVTNDLTNTQTKNKSAEMLKKYGLDKVMMNHESTGMVFFFNPKTKELIDQISASRTNPELVAAMHEAEKSVD